MFKHYLKVGFRNIIRNKFYTLINIIGLSTGMAASLILLLYVQLELSFDEFHHNKQDIYRINVQGEKSKLISAKSPFKLAPLLKETLPEIESICRVRKNELIVRKGENHIVEPGFIQTDSSFFDIFTFKFITGDPKSCLKNNNSIVITKSMAYKYFGKEDVIGETIEINLSERNYLQTITAVIDDFPTNSHIQADFILPIYTTIWSYENINRKRVYPAFESWRNNDFYTYFIFRGEINLDDYEGKITNTIKQHLGKDFGSDFQIQALNKIHLYSDHLISGVETKGNLGQIYLFGIIALLILSIAIINYIILSTTRSLVRIKEIGLRKVIGANRSNIVKQVLGESLIISFIALPISLTLAHFSLPFINQLLSKSISLDFSNPFLFPSLILICIITGIVSGSYIAFYLSSFKPIDVFRSQINLGIRGSIFQRSLIVLQLMIFIALVICSGIIYNQVRYMKNSNVLGFKKENLVSILTDNYRKTFNQKYPTFKNDLLKNPHILFVSSSFSGQPAYKTTLSYMLLRPLKMRGRIVDHWGSGGGDKLPEMPKDAKKVIIYEGNSVDYDYIEALGIKIKEGRSFDKNIFSDKKAVLVNEEFIKYYNVKNPLTEKFKFGRNYEQIIGIMKDFHTRSLTDKIKPVMYRMSHSFGPRYLRQVVIKLDGQNIQETLAFIDKTWKEYCPEAPFIYQFTDTYIDHQYKTEMNLARLIGIFALLAILIASLGLFGLSLSIAQRKTKEIVIRKTMGAKVKDIIIRLLKQFLTLTIIANIITMPLAYYLMDKWLQNFEYQVKMDYKIFLLAGISSILLCLITVSYHSAKAAITNPVQALKYE